MLRPRHRHTPAGIAIDVADMASRALSPRPSPRGSGDDPESASALLPMIDHTHFGFEQVDPEEKTRRVKNVFASVATKYDLMNDLMSAGMHRAWKRFTVEISGVRPGAKVLDVAGGTADLTRLFAERVGPAGKVVLTDINGAMLAVGRDRMINEGRLLPAVQCNAEALPFPPRSFDCVSIGFGLRNVTRKEKALAEMRRVLRPGGVALILEFSQVWGPLKPAYDWYSFNVLPRLGKFVVNDEASYRSLAESIRVHPDQPALKAMMEHAGFERVEWFNLTAGVVALHRGYVF
jgi:demethylmenaquinone methyltransferase/2-methoxy-6-polyprenyl-1,4-benzoquinol methylase